MRFVVLGGGCYGTFYTRQLLRAADAGAIPIPPPDIVVVDHNHAPQVEREGLVDARVHVVRSDWDAFFDAHLGTLAPDADDQLVPPPFTPHLALAWLLRALKQDRPELDWRIEPFSILPVTPFARQAENGTLAASHADWICPIHCIEPDVCPKTRGPRSWDMAETAHELAASLTARGQDVHQVHLLQCLHFTHGVGTYPLADLLRARRQAAQLQSRRNGPVRVLVGTVSRCHGAMHLLTGGYGTDTVSPQSTHSRGTTS
jgi:hypothetical protein